MARRAKAFIVACLAVSATAAAAQDHLVPPEVDQSFIAQDHAQLIRSVFAEAFAPDVPVRVIVWNPLRTERVIGIRQDNGRFHLFALEASERLFSYAEIDDERHEGASEREIRNWMDSSGLKSTTPSDVALNRWSLEIAPELAKKIKTAWEIGLSQTRTATQEEMDALYPVHDGVASVTVDGTELEFSDADGRSGTAYDPDARGGAALLVQISDDMERACMDKTPQAFAKLTQDVDAVVNRDKHQP